MGLRKLRTFVHAADLRLGAKGRVVKASAEQNQIDVTIRNINGYFLNNPALLGEDGLNGLHIIRTNFAPRNPPELRSVPP